VPKFSLKSGKRLLNCKEYEKRDALERMNQNLSMKVYNEKMLVRLVTIKAITNLQCVCSILHFLFLLLLLSIFIMGLLTNRD